MGVRKPGLERASDHVAPLQVFVVYDVELSVVNVDLNGIEETDKVVRRSRLMDT